MINIDLVNFTPLESFFGGICIGIAVILFFVTTGRIAGVSSIVNSSITTNKNWFSNFFFLIWKSNNSVFRVSVAELEITEKIEKNRKSVRRGWVS